ncbi:hypothetical protein [Sulfobacillus harzensis]|uniref:Penicillin-binding protein n=1 Tax=Sulfobacillus harzensis TaxID=2729629 RepID=A0A7Y0L5W2_9FIRM|nr:hypothetical protein [Sulfobacillus harzensis]NMP22479.1 hypothetical protein [Sulfobacillus harzensis]
MAWNHRLTVASSSAGIAALLAVAALLVFRLSHLAISGPSQAVMEGEVLSGPVTGQGGALLTRSRSQTALLIDPSELQAPIKADIQSQLGIRLGAKPRLQPVSGAVAKRWQARHFAGVTVVEVKTWVPKAGISPRILDFASQLTRQSPAVYQERGRVWEPLQQHATHTTLNLSLSQSLTPLARDGAIWVLGKDGQVLAAAGPWNSLWQSRPVGLAALPPLMSLASSRSQLQSALAGAHSLNQIGQLWGASAIRQALNTLGFGHFRIDSRRLASASLPRQPGPATVTTGEGLMASPAQVARAYLPLIDQGRLPALAMVPGTAKAAGHPVVDGTARRAVVGGLPAIREDGVSMRLWRPAGAPAVVLDARGGRVAVLSTGSASNALLVAALLASS